MEHPLRTYRKSAGISLQRLADQVGVTKSCLSKIETGAATPSISLAARIADATSARVTVADFIIMSSTRQTDPRQRGAEEVGAGPSSAAGARR